MYLLTLVVNFIVAFFTMFVRYIYTQTKKETSDFHGTVSFDLVKMLLQK